VVIEERVTKLEEVLTHYIQVQERELAAIRTSVAEIQLSVAQIRASNARTDARLLEMQEQADKDRQQAEEARQQAEEARQQDRQQAEKARQQDWQQAEKARQQDRQQAEKDRKDFNRRLAELSDSMGTLIEDMVAPCGFNLAKAIFGTEEAGECAIRVKRKHPADPGQLIELDLLAVGPSKVLVVEVKRRLQAAQVAEYKRKMERLAEFFPELAGKTLCLAVASVYLEPTVIVFLNREEIYGIAMGDEVMEVVNLGQF
jgi:multidrug efflux pump subunit AcrA (membrane-fusion protein)